MTESDKKRKAVGVLGEEIARNFLKKKGYRIIETNYRCKRGETDIIVKKKDWLVFVEVRTKTGGSFGTPEESITATKKIRMRKAAFHYRQDKTDLPEQWRIDMIAVELDAFGKLSRIEHIENAVEDD